MFCNEQKLADYASSATSTKNGKYVLVQFPNYAKKCSSTIDRSLECIGPGRCGRLPEDIHDHCKDLLYQRNKATESSVSLLARFDVVAWSCKPKTSKHGFSYSKEKSKLRQ